MPEAPLQSAQETVETAIERFGSSLVLSTSFQKEGMVVLDMAVRLFPSLAVVTLDTGRLAPETFQMIETVRERYGIEIELISPAAPEIGRMTLLYGPNLFYNNLASRMLCCDIRKVRPLARRLASSAACLTGLRRSQSETRAAIVQWDDSVKPVKINPLAFWSAEEVEMYTRLHDVPVHPLYAKGYTSIGCQPCTRAVEAGEGERAGRWWWEDGTQKECGLHFTPDGRARRIVDVMLDEVLNIA